MMDFFFKKWTFLEREAGKRHSLWEMDQLMRAISAERDGEEKRRGRNGEDLKYAVKLVTVCGPIADS